MVTRRSFDAKRWGNRNDLGRRVPIKTELPPRSPVLRPTIQEESTMLKWALIFFVVSLIAGFFGFSGVSATTAGIAKILFYIAIAVFMIFMVLALMGGALVL
jgi:uncharacterized membrane protein YtjA (UPF0391 family)